MILITIIIITTCAIPNNCSISANSLARRIRRLLHFLYWCRINSHTRRVSALYILEIIKYVFYCFFSCFVAKKTGAARFTNDVHAEFSELRKLSLVTTQAWEHWPCFWRETLDDFLDPPTRYISVNSRCVVYHNNLQYRVE